MLNIEIFPDAESIAEDEAQHFTADYVSLVNHDTYGPPALVAPSPRGDQGPRASIGEKVLYINTSLVPAFTLERAD